MQILSRCAIGDAKDSFILAASKASAEILAELSCGLSSKGFLAQVNVWSPCLTAKNC